MGKHVHLDIVTPIIIILVLFSVFPLVLAETPVTADAHEADRLALR